MSSPLQPYLPSDIDGIEQLLTLALDLRWSWNHFADQLWGQLDPELWSLTHNPWVVLQTVSVLTLTHRLATFTMDVWHTRNPLSSRRDRARFDLSAVGLVEPRTGREHVPECWRDMI